ncbi:DNA helicase PcrA [Clostridiaceae bacterium AF42-6]|nr:DNA helicase PcrA [Clostridiaceae bacterium AF42-6]RHP47804.1 DNA helicase PcrA [Clostridiaceae bacterium AF31-3BH]RHQ21779.1 DNA helicase PcrA [Clostridiaceae bacterium AF29-16BH]
MSDLELLNREQQEAVLHVDGPLLILAGAGSGKTRVLTYRIAHLIDECGVNPWNILAITFTNKAAGEMRERVDKIVGYGSESIWVSTFHSTCVRILRRYIDRLGYDTNFTIYDTEDQKTVMKSVCQKLQLDSKLYKERMLLNVISHAKDEYISPNEFLLEAKGDFRQEKIAQAYVEYQKELKKNNALDFDDLLVKTVELFQSCPDVLEYYQNRFRYIMVDEYQDTNTVQFKFISTLARQYRNLCVVGDDDQSIYKFRGANIRNILDFEKVFPDAKVVKLEQNYRSTQNILNAANGVIANNRGRKEKALWTENEQGEPILFQQFQNGYEEAEYVSGEISKKVRKGEAEYQDFAVLYRTNAQSRLFEEKFLYANIPYKIVGGVNFYSRKEIKDILAYLKTIDNGKDDLAVRRIINVPKRGIGNVTLAKVQAYADSRDISFFEALEEAGEIPGLGKAALKIQPFVHLIHEMRLSLADMSIQDLIQAILDKTGYAEDLKNEDTDESEARLENIDEFINKAVTYEEGAEEPNLSGFLEEVALVADIDSVEDGDNRVLLMTLHSAKGLEFPYVYLAGMEDGLFPSYMSIAADDPTEEIEEERRLCYVGITRAMKELTITCARCRMVRGETQYNNVSRFVREIPSELLARKSVMPREPKKLEVPQNTSYQKAKEVFRTKTFDPQQFKVVKADKLDYTVGDQVSHVKFGKGTVLEITEGGRDYEVKVDFERFGVKKMFASFAKLKKV